MQQYMLILHENADAFDELSPADMQTIVEKYSRWAESLAERGLHAGGEKLADGVSRHLTQESETITVIDGPYAEAKEVIGGYFIVRADNLDHAESLARDCPHLEYGGRIELRLIDEL